MGAEKAAFLGEGSKPPGLPPNLPPPPDAHNGPHGPPGKGHFLSVRLNQRFLIDVSVNHDGFQRPFGLSSLSKPRAHSDMPFDKPTQGERGFVISNGKLNK